jgi:hypothetical protein
MGGRLTTACLISHNSFASPHSGFPQPQEVMLNITDDEVRAQYQVSSLPPPTHPPGRHSRPRPVVPPARRAAASYTERAGRPPGVGEWGAVQAALGAWLDRVSQ